MNTIVVWGSFCGYLPPPDPEVDPEPALEIIYLAEEYIGIPQEELESIPRKQDVWNNLLSLLFPLHITSGWMKQLLLISIRKNLT